MNQLDTTCGDVTKLISVEDDLLAEGEPEREFNPGIAARLPRKRIAAGALYRDDIGRILFVVPNYKPGLDIPGGVVEANEQPRSACLREVREETGVGLAVGRLLVVDWIPAHGPWGDAMMFIFDGGSIGGLPKGMPIDSELDGLILLHLNDASDRLRPSMLRRLRLAVRAAQDEVTIYSEFGRPV